MPHYRRRLRRANAAPLIIWDERLQCSQVLPKKKDNTRSPCGVEPPSGERFPNKRIQKVPYYRNALVLLHDYCRDIVGISCSIHAVFLQYACSIHAVFLQYSCSIPAVFMQHSCSIPAAFLYSACQNLEGLIEKQSEICRQKTDFFMKN